MATTFNPMVVTEAGLSAYMSYLQGATLSITRIAIGNGEYTDEEKTTAALQTMTALKAEKNTFIIQTAELSSTQMKLQSVIRNYDPDTHQTIVDEPYYMNELGLFARADGEEFLFGIAICSGEQGDAISTYTGNNPIQIIQNITLQIDNAQNITVVVAPDIIASLVSYDNTTSGLSSTTVQGAIDELAAGGGSSTVSLATEEEVRSMAENLFREAGGTIDDNARVAEETEVEEAIDALDDI